MTDLEFFDAWPMCVLLSLLATSLIIVTLRRIPLTLYKLGVWTVHIGILTLIAGCVWYFSQKTEGTARIFLGQTVSSYYDATERTLYAYNVNPDGSLSTQAVTMTPLPRLPIYHEYLPDRGTGLDRALPPETLGQLSPALRDAKLRIIGYYPFAELGSTWTSGPDVATGTGNPAVCVSMTVQGESGGKWLVALQPAAHVLDAAAAPFGIEYVYHPDDRRLADITASFTGEAALTVRIPKLHYEKTFVAEQDKPLVLEGTPYTLTPRDQMAMPLVSKGYEGAFSNALSVDVQRKDKDAEFAFRRMSLSRYPERSPDFVIENGKQKRVQDRVDNDIEIIFHDALRDQFWIVEQPGGALELVHRLAGGKVERAPMVVGKAIESKVRDVPLRVEVTARTANAIPQPFPQIIPVQQRPRNQTAMDVMRTSMVRLSLEANGFANQDIYVPFTEYANTSPPPLGKPPAIVDIPGIGRIALVLSTTRRELPSSIQLLAFEPVKYKGAIQTYSNYISTLQITDLNTGRSHVDYAQQNGPAEDHGLYYFQAFWDGNDDAKPDERFSGIGVANRPGIGVMELGALMIILGTAYAFYVKPLLLNLKKQQLAAWAAEHARGAS